MDVSDQGFVDQWRHVAPILVNVERSRLREYGEPERQKDIEALLSLPICIPATSIDTGLIEQQRLFLRQRR